MRKQSNAWLDNVSDNEFITANETPQLNDIDEVTKVVEALTEDPEPETTVQYDMEKAQLAAGIVSEYIRRTRLLTIAVVAIALYLVIKEIK